MKDLNPTSGNTPGLPSDECERLQGLALQVGAMVDAAMACVSGQTILTRGVMLLEMAAEVAGELHQGLDSINYHDRIQGGRGQDEPSELMQLFRQRHALFAQIKPGVSSVVHKEIEAIDKRIEGIPARTAAELAAKWQVASCGGELTFADRNDPFLVEVRGLLGLEEAR